MTSRRVPVCVLLAAVSGACDSTTPRPPLEPLLEFAYHGDQVGGFMVLKNGTPPDTVTGPFAAASITTVGDVYLCAMIPEAPRVRTLLLLSLGAVMDGGSYDLPHPPIPGSLAFTPGEFTFSERTSGVVGGPGFRLVWGWVHIASLTPDSISGEFSAVFATPFAGIGTPLLTTAVSDGRFHLPLVPGSAVPHVCRLE